MKWLWSIPIVVVGLIIGLSVYLQPNSFQLCPQVSAPDSRKGCGAADAIIAISGGDTSARAAHAIELYQEGYAPILIFSGAAQDKSGPSNATAMANQAIAAGVPTSAILTEDNADNTQENASNTVQLLTQNNIDNVILVTSGYHQRRASLEFAQATKGDHITVRNSPTNDKDWNFWWWLTPRGWWLAGGEVAKIIAFYGQGGK